MDDQCKVKRSLLAYAIAVMSVVAVIFVLCELHRIVTVLQPPSVRHSVVECCCSSNLLNCISLSAQGKAYNASFNYKDALEVLRNEQTNWLTVLGLFGVVFGLLIPVGAYLLQRQSLREERSLMREELMRSQELMEKNFADEKDINQQAFDSLRGDIARVIKDARALVGAEIKEDLKPVWNFLAANFDQALVNEGKCLLQKEFPNWVVVANFVIGLDICLDCLVRAESTARLIEVIQKYKPNLTASIQRHPQGWSEVFGHLEDKMRPSAEFLSGADYAALIGKDSKTFDWLKSFYDNFAPWKFA